MTQVLWILLTLQLALGAFDIVYHHELTEHLAWRPSQRRELQLHGVRNLAYAVLFAALGWSRPYGLAAVCLIGLMAAELIVTLWDFVEEDRSRRLPPSERVTHALLALNYGALLLVIVPMFARQASAPTAILPAYHGLWSWACAAASLGVILFGLRDLGAAARLGRTPKDQPSRLATALGQRRSVLITGGTGFVGSRLVEALAAAGHEITVLTRSPHKAKAALPPVRMVSSLDEIVASERIDAIVNLAGEPISDGLWTARKRRRILRSRLEVTREIGRLIRRLRSAPDVLVSGSAVGWYGLRDDEPLSESAGFSDCFSHQLCQRWERAALKAAGANVRLVRLRIGLVLAAEGGVLSRMLTPFDFGLGCRFGSGRQWMSWIHRDDLVRLIIHAIACPYLSGRLNATAPEAVTNGEFTAALGKALHRPAFISIPARGLRMALGSMAEEVLLGGQRVGPARAMTSGFRFTYPRLEDALAAIAPPAHERRRQGSQAHAPGSPPDPAVGQAA